MTSKKVKNEQKKPSYPFKVFDKTLEWLFPRNWRVLKDSWATFVYSSALGVPKCTLCQFRFLGIILENLKKSSKIQSYRDAPQTLVKHEQVISSRIILDVFCFSIIA